jgi:ribonucleoside-diphosphate reductase alpha chain
MAQAVWQKWISNAIAKTINMPGDVTVEDVKCAYLLAHEFGLKGVTIYRDGSRNEQVLHITGSDREKRFQVYPSKYLHDFIISNVREPYVLDQVMPIFKDYINNSQKFKTNDDGDTLLKSETLESNHRSVNSSADLYLSSQSRVVENNKESCPVCKNFLIITEGCNMCIECGFSSCGSG